MIFTRAIIIISVAVAAAVIVAVATRLVSKYTARLKAVGGSQAKMRAFFHEQHGLWLTLICRHNALDDGERDIHVTRSGNKEGRTGAHGRMIYGCHLFGVKVA